MTRGAEFVLSPVVNCHSKLIVQRVEAEHADMVRRFGVRFDLPIDLIRELGAIRPICKFEDCEQYIEDIKTLGNANVSVSNIRAWLYVSRFTYDERYHWYDVASGAGYITTTDDQFCSEDETSTCEHCDDTYSDDEDFRTVRINSRCTQQWCDVCTSNHAFFCDFSDVYYCEDNYGSTTVGDGRTLCQEVADRYDYYYCEVHDEYCYGGSCDEESDDEDTDSDGIPNYHKARRNWSYEVANRSTRAFYGFELEIEFEDSGDRREFYNSWIYNGSPDICAETDGSLHDECGLEFITRPIPMQELRDPANFFKSIVDKLKAAGACVGDNHPYGIHITSNWGRLSKDHKVRLNEFVFQMKPMVTFVSGRDCEEYAPFVKNTMGHYTAFHIRHDQAVEMRTFESTTDWKRIMGYVEFLDAMTEYTRNPHSVVNGPLAASLFRCWLRFKPEYPNIVSRFFKPHHTIKEMPSCVSPSSNREVARLVKSDYGRVLKTIPTEQASQSWLVTGSLAQMEARIHAAAEAHRELMTVDNLRQAQAPPTVIVSREMFESIRASSPLMPSTPPTLRRPPIPAMHYYISESPLEAMTPRPIATLSELEAVRSSTTEQSLGLENTESENQTRSYSPRWYTV